MKQENIIITGGAGFIGSNLATYLQNLGHNILIIDNFTNGDYKNLKEFRGEIIPNPIHRIDLNTLKEYKTIIHLASITDTTIHDQTYMLQNNINPFKQIINHTLKNKIKLIWASSAAVYGQSTNKPLKITDAGNPINVYGYSKWAMENIHRKHQHQIPITALRFFNVFGQHENHKHYTSSMIHQMAKHAKNNPQTPIKLHKNGDQARDFIPIQDVIEAIYKTYQHLKTPKESSIYNIGTGTAITFNQIANEIKNTINQNITIEYPTNAPQEFQKHTQADTSQNQIPPQWNPPSHQEIINKMREYIQHIT